MAWLASVVYPAIRFMFAPKGAEAEVSSVKVAAVANSMQPNSGKIIIGSKGDDKVICYCGKENPNSPHPESASGGSVDHRKAFLERSTEEAWKKQEGRP